LTSTLTTDDVETRWKHVLSDLRVQVTYALSPQAKGKIERPYRWLQDRLVRTCAREKITEIEDAQQVLGQETYRYNYHQIHSTTGEIPIVRFETATEGKQSLYSGR
jgi:diphthamide synthase subunit DPH2